ncbi:cytochrome P450 [Actinoplanes teichomyceticus]|uniref:Cytochrome P450 n=1 Tax=Actinoplanes teichomyceticus TaxID=1867 RepID=A0A561WIY0_ACTTI|nr:cytochrome P450 [Actinoplanes teichomyceticus]TWG23832.1 cytochrome P450 [Actinoplanes teichomyceticus]GIF11876.1 cytochrome P450 [Actinoplanes teichomyceticus]
MTTVVDTGRMPPFALGAAQIADPYPVYRRYLATDPVHRQQRHDGADTWYVFGYDDVSAVLSDRRYGRRGPGGGSAVPIPARYAALHDVVTNWLVFLDPPRHTALRSKVAGHFAQARVTPLRPRIEALVDGLLTGLAGRPVVDLVADFAAPLPILVIADLLGVPAAQHRWLRRHAVALQQANTSHRGDGFPAADRAARELSDFFAAQAERRGRTDADDLVAHLLAAGLTGVELASTCIHLLTAGHETTTNLLAKSVLALLRHPDVHAELSAVPEAMPPAVEELIRYDSPVQMVRRRARQDVALGGRHIDAGSTVVLVLGSANRDPARFPDPDRLDIHRDTTRHTGFGIGIHYCVGAHLARLEAEIGLAGLLRRLPRLSLAEHPVPYADDLVFHGPSRLLVHPGSR